MARLDVLSMLLSRNQDVRDMRRPRGGRRRVGGCCAGAGWCFVD